MQNLADAIALQALYQAYLKWVEPRVPSVYFRPLDRVFFAHTYKFHPLPDALPALWR